LPGLNRQRFAPLTHAPPPVDNKRMKSLLIAFVALAGAMPCLSAARVEPLRAERGVAHRLCTANRLWCTERRGDSLTVLRRENGGRREVAHLPLPSNEDDRSQSEPWSSIVRISLPGRPELALVGVVRTQSEMYSGGGGLLVQLTLFEIQPEAQNQPRAVLEAPLSSSFLIRACFSREDERARRGACHDEYRYSATLTAPPQRPNDARLVYRSRADSFPNRRSRTQDSNRQGPLRRGDLIRVVDRTCTFERTLARNPETGIFKWSAPLPPCKDYLELQ
jgi:hypothetical protein